MSDIASNIKHKQKLYVLVAVLIIASVGLRLINQNKFEQTTILLIGLPSLITLLIANGRKPKTLYGVAFRTTSMFLLMGSILFGEGLVSIFQKDRIWIEFILISILIVLAYHWVYLRSVKKYPWIKSLSQVISIGLLFTVFIPILLNSILYVIYHKSPSPTHLFPLSIYKLELFLLIIFPGLVAVNDLVTKGNGKPFTHGKIKILTRTGIYAYNRNPIQWSFTMMFLSLGVYYTSPWIILASIVFIVATYGISEYVEYGGTQSRFCSNWSKYKKHTPKWIFLWESNNIPMGTIFFDHDCGICMNVRSWFINKETINLEFRPAATYKGPLLLQVTYVDHNEIEYKSVIAIACALEHINLGYAILGWVMRFPIINYILQIIIDSMGLGEREGRCDL